MSTTTATFGHTIEAPATAEPRKGFLARLMEARMMQSRAHIRSVFQRMSDKQMADIGFTPDEARQVRATGIMPDSYLS